MVPLMMAALMAAGCASTPAPSVSKVKDGDPATVNRDCKLLGTVNGRSVFGASEENRTKGAVEDARAKAAAMGATDIVILKIDASGMFNTGYATARAYKC